MTEFSVAYYGLPGSYPRYVQGSATANAMLEIQTGPTDVARLLELTLTLDQSGSGAAAQTIGVGVPAARGVGVGGARVGFNDSADTSALPQVFVYSWWSTPPTVPTKFFRRGTINSITGGGSQGGPMPYRWLFPRGIVIGPSSSLVLWMINNSGVTLTVSPQIVIDI